VNADCFDAGILTQSFLVSLRLLASSSSSFVGPLNNQTAFSPLYLSIFLFSSSDCHFVMMENSIVFTF
jgi:hypothetical protein